MIENQCVHVEVFSTVDDGLGYSWCRYLQNRIFVYLGDLLQFDDGVEKKGAGFFCRGALDPYKNTSPFDLLQRQSKTD